MKYGVLVMTGCSVVFFVLASMFGAKAYFQARQLSIQVEMMTVRTHLIRQQIGELEKKARILQRVDDFVDHAQKMQLTPRQWTRYDVTVQEEATFRELANMIEQCAHNRDLYFKPISLQVSMGSIKDSSIEAAAVQLSPAGDPTKKTSDVAVVLKGAFWVKQ
jgi:hypothetical protein